MTDNEVWKDIPGFDGYQVSNHGRVKSFRKWRGLPTPHFLKLIPRGGKNSRFSNYKVVGLRSSLDGKTYTIQLHRIVLLSFVGPCPDGMETCHNDGDASNNHLDNLRWDTRDANMRDRVKHNREKGTQKAKRRIRINRTQLMTIQAELITRAIREYRDIEGATLKATAEKHGFSESYLSLLVRGKRTIPTAP